MNGYIVTTEAGYSVYVGSVQVADVSEYAAAIASLRSSALPWNGEIVHCRSTYMPCQ